MNPYEHAMDHIEKRLKYHKKRDVHNGQKNTPRTLAIDELNHLKYILIRLEGLDFSKQDVVESVVSGEWTNT